MRCTRANVSVIFMNGQRGANPERRPRGLRTHRCSSQGKCAEWNFPASQGSLHVQQKVRPEPTRR